MTRGDRMTRKEWETITIRDFDRLRADLAEANATIAAQALVLKAGNRLADAMDEADQWLGVGPILEYDRAQFDTAEREFKAALSDYRRARAALRVHGAVEG